MTSEYYKGTVFFDLFGKPTNLHPSFATLESLTPPPNLTDYTVRKVLPCVISLTLDNMHRDRIGIDYNNVLLETAPEEENVFVLASTKEIFLTSTQVFKFANEYAEVSNRTILFLALYKNTPVEIFNISSSNVKTLRELPELTFEEIKEEKEIKNMVVFSGDKCFDVTPYSYNKIFYKYYIEWLRANFPGILNTESTVTFTSLGNRVFFKYFLMIHGIKAEINGQIPFEFSPKAIGLEELRNKSLFGAIPSKIVISNFKGKIEKPSETTLAKTVIPFVKRNRSEASDSFSYPVNVIVDTEFENLSAMCKMSWYAFLYGDTGRIKMGAEILFADGEVILDMDDTILLWSDEVISLIYRGPDSITAKNRNTIKLITTKTIPIYRIRELQHFFGDMMEMKFVFSVIDK